MTALAEAVLRIKERPAGEMSGYIAGSFPDTMRALRGIDYENSRPRRRKGFNLVKRENKKSGFVYYVRFYHGGKMLPSKWNTHTNSLEEAERFARARRESLVSRYLRARDTRAYELLERFYAPGSAMLACEGKRNRGLSERSRKEYGAVMVKKFIPFLKKERVAEYGEISAGTLGDFQDYLLAAGEKPQTVNNNLKAVKRVLAYLARKGIIENNPGGGLRGIPVSRADLRVRGCYEVGKVKGVFNRRWKEEEAYLLCLMIYATGMRNGEIARVRLGDIKRIEGCRFIEIRESKTAAGKRLVPLHEFVYRRLAAYAGKQGREEAVFGFRNAGHFKRANNELAWRLKVGEEEAEREGITYYSGRHYWKTLMNSEGLGEGIEEVFMGHKVSGNVAERYNHKDKRGKKQMVKKARQVFAILDRCLFAAKGQG